MSGFILGTGSGILASAAVYYTISTSLASSTSGLRSELHNSSSLLANSFDPTPPPAHSSLIGPSAAAPYANRPFGSLLREKWNETLSSAVVGVRSTDWSSVGAGIYQAGEGVVSRIGSAASAPSTAPSTSTSTSTSTVTSSSTVSDGAARSVAKAEQKTEGLVQDVKDVVAGVAEETKVLAKGIRDDTKSFPKDVKDAVDGIDLKRGSIGTVGGNAFKEQVKRNAEEKGGRLV